MNIFSKSAQELESDLKEAVKAAETEIHNEITALGTKISEFVIEKADDGKSFIIFEKKKVVKVFLFLALEVEQYVRHKEDLVHNSAEEAEQYITDFLTKQKLKATAFIKKI